MYKLLLAAAGVFLLMISAIYVFISGNAFITPSSQQITPIPTTIPTASQEKIPSQIIIPSQQDDENLWTCPPNGWINCMPIIDDSRKYQCEDEYIGWVKSNCDNFQGVTY